MSGSAMRLTPGVRRCRAHRLASLGILAIALTISRPAAGYEFEVIARTIGEAQARRTLRLSAIDPILSARVFTQTLSLNIWDIGRIRDHRLRKQKLYRGPSIYLTSYLRIQHDFGAWSTGSLVDGNRVYDAVDLVPELEARLLNLEVLFAYLAIDDLADGMLHLRVGRQLEVGTLDWWSMDGVTLRVTPRAPVAVEGFVGLRVRDHSPAGSSTFEPDGTGSAECAEYVEGPMPGSGSWRPIDRGLSAEQDPFASDYQFCPQRQQLMPTFGGAIELARMANVWARVSYRRSQSPTPGLIGPIDRFPYPDTGLYPNENGQTPGWGVNEERLSATVRSHHRFAKGRGQITPYAAIRYNALLGLVDEQHTGVRVRHGAHLVEPEYFYSFPSFDGDSIFNVFSTQAYHDLRLTYGLRPERNAFSGYARIWGRRFQTEDPVPDDPDTEAPGDLAGGLQVGVSHRLPQRAITRLDLFVDGGYGGSRIGGHLATSWRARYNLDLRGRLSLVDFDEDLRADLNGISVGLMAGASYRINDGITAHVTAEHTSNRIDRNRFRIMGMLDLALIPEV